MPLNEKAPNLVMIIIKNLQSNQILILNNPLGVDVPLNKYINPLNNYDYWTCAN